MQLRLVAVAATALTLVITPVAASAAGPDGSARPMQYRHLKQQAAERAAHAKAFKAQEDSDEGGEDPEEIAERAEQSAVILTTNLPFSEWTQVIPNARLCKALLDRITDRAHILETGTDSYRFRRTLDQRKRKSGHA